jgi:hypothetical protein
MKSRFEFKYVVAIGSALLIFAGLYLNLLYDVPDAEAATNTTVSWSLIILGVLGVVISLAWRKKKNPLSKFQDGL